MVMLPRWRREFVRMHFGPHLNGALFKLDEPDLRRMAGALDCDLVHFTARKEHLERAIALLAAEVWFESVAASPRSFEKRLSLIGKQASALANELGPQDSPDLIVEYLAHCYKQFLYARPSAAPPLLEIIKALKTLEQLSHALSNAFVPHRDARKHHELGFKSFLLSLVVFVRPTPARMSLPTKNDPDIPTRFTNFVHAALDIATEKAAAAIAESTYLPTHKARAIEKLGSYRAVTLPSLTAAIRRLRNIRGGKPRDMVDMELLQAPEEEPRTSQSDAHLVD